MSNLNDAIAQGMGVPSPGAVSDKMTAFFRNIKTGNGSPANVVTGPGFYYDLQNDNIWTNAAANTTGWTQLGAGGGGSGAMSLISSTTLAAAAASISASAIPATFSHLKVLARLRGDAAAVFVGPRVSFNNDAGANYYQTSNSVIGGVNTPAASVSGNFVDAGRAPAATGGTDPFGLLVMDIMHYADAGRAKTVLLKSGFATGTAANDAFLDGVAMWDNLTAAINSIAINPASGNWVAGSSLYVYGLS